MDRETVELFFALLTVVAASASVALIVCHAFAHRSERARVVVDAISPYANPLAATVALTCMIGSLYFSEVANFLPCTLCWYQRIAMYPLGVILAIATARRDRSIRWYVAPLAAIGACISMYHWLLERFPNLDSGVCSAQIPCEFVWFEEFGFITLPFMALIGFVTVITLVTLPTKE